MAERVAPLIIETNVKGLVPGNQPEKSVYSEEEKELNQGVRIFPAEASLRPICSNLFFFHICR